MLLQVLFHISENDRISFKAFQQPNEKKKNALQNDPDQLADGDDQRPEGGRPQVVADEAEDAGEDGPTQAVLGPGERINV